MVNGDVSVQFCIILLSIFPVLRDLSFAPCMSANFSLWSPVSKHVA
jgi:hypothetical protein